MTEALEATRRLLSYIDASPTPFHAVAESPEGLDRAEAGRDSVE